MDRCIEKSYALKPAEFAVLAAAAGIESVPALFKRRLDLTGEDIYYTCFNLSSRGIMDSDGRISDELHGIFSVIAAAGHAVYVKEGAACESGSGDFICYPSGLCVSLRISRMDEDRIFLQAEKPDRFLARLKEEGLLPVPESDYSEKIMEQEGIYSLINCTNQDISEITGTIIREVPAVRALYSVFDRETSSFESVWILAGDKQKVQLIRADRARKKLSMEGREGCRQLMDCLCGT